MKLKKILRVIIPCAIMSFAQLVSNATTEVLPAGSTVPSVIDPGDVYICQGPYTFYGDYVTIRPQGKLIIQDGATLKMSGRITVLNGSASGGGSGSPTIIYGGVLELTNATITSSTTTATDRWLGIEVRGQDDFLTEGTGPYYEIRGKVIINGGTITKATCGISTTSRVFSSGSIYSYPKKEE